MKVYQMQEFHKSKNLRDILRGEVYKRKKQIDTFLKDEKLDRQFKGAGYPLGIDGITFQYIRYSLLLIIIFIFLAKLLGDFSKQNVFVGIFTISLFVLFTMPGKYSPLTFVLDSINKWNISSRNKELFTLFNLISDEIHSSHDDARNLRSMLMELRLYTKLIRPSIDLALANWHRGSEQALNLLAKQIGTLEADEICKLLVDIDKSDADKALELLEDRKETFQTLQKENRRRKLKIVQNYLYGAAFAPVLIYLWNVISLIMVNTMRITQFTNNFN